MVHIYLIAVSQEEGSGNGNRVARSSFVAGLRKQFEVRDQGSWGLTKGVNEAVYRTVVNGRLGPDETHNMESDAKKEGLYLRVCQLVDLL